MKLTRAADLLEKTAGGKETDQLLTEIAETAY
jgi:hypothetical protein